MRLCAALLLLLHCHGDPDRVAPPPAGYVGDFTLAHVTTHTPGSDASVLIFAEVSFSESDADSAPTLDAGDSITLTLASDSAIEIPLIRRSIAGRTFYQRDPNGGAIPESNFVSDSTYVLSSVRSQEDGGVPTLRLEEALHTPTPLTVTAPDFSQGIEVDQNSELTLTWSVDPVAADSVRAILAVSDGTEGEMLALSGSDNGSLTISAATLAQVGAGTGTLTLYKVNEQVGVLPADGSYTGLGLVGHTTTLTILP